MPGPDPSTVTAAYKRGLALARSGAFFDAHEAFEEAWRACAPEERDFFQGLVHVVVSAYQRERGRPVAEERQRLKALRRLAPYAPSHRALDVELVVAALERAEADPREHLVERNAQPPVAVEEEQEAERHERRARQAADDDVVVPHPAEGAHRVRERDAGRDERRGEAE
jgi:predicted metal-dependent hydrolase